MSGKGRPPKKQTRKKGSRSLEKNEPLTEQKNRDRAGKSTNHLFVKPNTAFPRFKEELFNLEDAEFEAVASTREKLKWMTWNQVYATSSKGAGKRGLNFEPIDQWTAEGRRIATIRVSKKFRARVVRNHDVMLFISLHPDHDSAYTETGGEASDPLP